MFSLTGTGAEIKDDTVYNCSKNELPGYNLTTKVRELYAENRRTLVKDVTAE